MQATALFPRPLRLPSRLLRGASDERLVTALRRGDETAFEAIYDRHHRALLGFCRHMLGSHEEAEDALQRVFVSAHDHLREGTAQVNLKPWLYTIARNRCLSMLRARRETLALDDVHEPSSDGLALADAVELGEELKDLLGDIARLPDEQRAALVLAELGDLSQQEIAATLDVRTDKVKALIFQARETLAGWRQARAVSCREICEQLSTLKGSALRRAPIRRHLALCPACTAFEAEVKHQRVALSLLLPVVPSVALKHSVLTAALSGRPGRRGRGRRRRRRPAAGASGLTVKALVVAALAVSAGGGGVVAVRELEQPRPVERPAPATTRAPAAAAVAAPSAGPRRIAAPAGRSVGSARLGHRLPGRRKAGGQASPRRRRLAARPAAVRGTLRHGPSAGGGTRRARPAAGGGSQTAGPRREGPPGARDGSAPARRSPRRASGRRRRRPPRTASRADRPTFVAAARLRGHEDPHHTLADRRPRLQHHRIRGRLDSFPDRPRRPRSSAGPSGRRWASSSSA